MPPKVVMDLNIQNDNGDTLFMIGCYKGRMEIVQELITHTDQYNINRQNVYGFTALHWACAGNQLEVVQQLCTIPHLNMNLLSDDGDTPFMVACDRNYKAIALELLKYHTRFNINQQSRDFKTKGYTMLHSACLSNQYDILQKLCTIESCDINKQNDDGDTAFMIACNK